jgi:hypothetical protein
LSDLEAHRTVAGIVGDPEPGARIETHGVNLLLQLPTGFESDQFIETPYPGFAKGKTTMMIGGNHILRSAFMTRPESISENMKMSDLHG